MLTNIDAKSYQPIDHSSISARNQHEKEGPLHLQFTKKPTFDLKKDYLSKDQCTSIFFGNDPIQQKSYICPSCNPNLDKTQKLCKFCYDECHQYCRNFEPPNSDKCKNELNTLKTSSFICFCGVHLKHIIILPPKKELIPCNMLQLDQVLNVGPCTCHTHSIKICYICVVTCHANCNIMYQKGPNSGTCHCKTDYHSGYNELAMTFPLNDYKDKTKQSIWPIQILNILFNKKNVFQRMSKLFIETLNSNSSIINESFFPLLELFSNTLNRKFKTYYYDQELFDMFNYNSIITFMSRLPMNKPKILLVKFRLLFIILFIHLKKDYNYQKTLTSIDFVSIPILERFKYRLMLSSKNDMTELIIIKYGAKNEYLIKVALEEVCNLMIVGMDHLSIEENQDEFEIGLKYLCFLLKRMIFNNEQLNILIKSIYSFYDRFFEYLNDGKSNIYSLLSIFFTLIEIFYLIAVNFNDNVIYEALKHNKKVKEFIHYSTESGGLLFKMVIKSCEIFTKHYKILQKSDLETKSKEEKKREAAKEKHLLLMQQKIESTTTGVKMQMPENGGLVLEKLIVLFNETLKIFALADNAYYLQIEQLQPKDLDDFYLFRSQINNKTFGMLFSTIQNNTNIQNNTKIKPINHVFELKKEIERLLGDLFMGSYDQANLRIGYNISAAMDKFVSSMNTMLIEQAALQQRNPIKYSRTYTMNPSLRSSYRKIKVSSLKQGYSGDTKEEIFTNKILNSLKKTFKFLSNDTFKIHQEQFVNSLILYNLDETITKLLVYFSNRDFPHLLSYDLLKQIFSFLSLYFLTENGLKYFLLGKNLTRLCKIIKRYCCLKSKKNNIVDSKTNNNRMLHTNLPYVEKTLKFLYIMGKGINLYGLSLKNHKILQRLKRTILEHINYFSQEQNIKSYVVILKRHICLSLKFFNLFFKDYEYEEFEEIKMEMMKLFDNPYLNLLNNNAFVSLMQSAIYNIKNRNMRFDNDNNEEKKENIDNKASINHLNTNTLLIEHTEENNQQTFTLLNEENKNSRKNNKSIFNKKDSLIQNNHNINAAKLINANHKENIEREKLITIKLYFFFFDLVTKNTYYAFINSEEEKLYKIMFQFNKISEIQPIFMSSLDIISLSDRRILIAFLRTMAFIEKLDRISIFNKYCPLTNQEYKQMIYNQIIYVDGINFTEGQQINVKIPEMSTDDLVHLNEKHKSIQEIEKVIEIYIYELTIFPEQLDGFDCLDIKEYLDELIFGIKFISDWFYFSKDIVNCLVLKFYFITKYFLNKSDIFINILKDLKETGFLKIQGYEHQESEKEKAINHKDFSMYNKELLYKYLTEEINLIFKETDINNKCSLEKYLDTFDNMSEANFTPFSLIETYDYEYFYQEEENDDCDNDLSTRLTKIINSFKEEYIAQFINIRSTAFFNVITSISNDSIRVDYRGKVVSYFHSFLNSTEAYKTFKMETLMCIIDKMMFYDGEEMQGKFNQMRKDKFFFPNINLRLHENIILTITSAKNSYVFQRSIELISLTKLTIQFLQLLGEGFNTDYHDNLFKLQKDVAIADVEDESDESDYQEEEDNVGEEDAYDTTENPISRTQNKKSISHQLNGVLGISEINNYQIDETIYHSFINNLKRSFQMLDLNQQINAEMPYDKLIVLTTNIIDFLIEYIQTSEDKEYIIIEALKVLFLGKRQNSKDSFFVKIEKKGVLMASLFSQIKSRNPEEYQLRRKMICYVKMKYLQLLISYLQAGKHIEMVEKLIEHRCSTIELYHELLLNFHSMLLQIKVNHPDSYETLISKTSDNAFVDELLYIYVYQGFFQDLIEYPLCMKLYILIKIFEDLYHQNTLQRMFEKLDIVKLPNDPQMKDIGINTVFSKRIHLFLEKVVLKVEIRNDQNNGSNGKYERFASNISSKILSEMPNSDAVTTEEEGEAKDVEQINVNFPSKENEEQSSKIQKGNSNQPPPILEEINEESETRLSFFVRPYLTFRLSKQSMNNFESKVDRTNATSKFVELISFSDYSILEMVVNQHIIGKSSIKKFFSNLTYDYIELINYLMVIIQNIFLIIHYFRSPNMDAQHYDLMNDSIFYTIWKDNYILTIIQLIFLWLSFINWIYFKFPLCYQYNIMKRFNKNFVFRKKGEGSSAISNTIVRYFQDSSMSPYSVIFDKNKDVGLFSAFIVFVFDSLIFNREICVLIYNIILLTFYLRFGSGLCLVIPMIFIANINVTLFDIFKAIKIRFTNMALVILFIFLICYIYTWITYFYMSFLFSIDDILDRTSHAKINESFCKSSLQCFFFITSTGLRAGGGIGDELPRVSFQTNPGFFVVRFFYDMFFFVFIILVLFNVFMGIIVDTFAELRDINWGRENDINNICYICQLSRDDCLTKNIDFNKHIASDHFLWNYVYYLVYLHISNPNEFNSTENSVWSKLEEQDFGWIPITSDD